MSGGARMEREIIQSEVSPAARRGQRFGLQHARRQRRDAEAGARAAPLEALPPNVAVLDRRGVIVSVNWVWRGLSDAHEPRQLNYGIGRDYLALCDDASGLDQSAAREAAAGIRSVLRGAARRFSVEYFADSPSERRWFLLTAAPVHDQHSKGVIVTHSDITERKRVEEHLRQFAAVMDAMPDGIFLIDRCTMRMIYVNQAAGRLHGLKRDQVLALKPWEALNISRKELERTYDAVEADGGASAPVEGLWNRRHAHPIWIETRRHAQLIGGRRMIVSLVRDVSARKEAETRMAYSNRLYSVLSRINTLIVRVRDRDELHREACRLAVADGALAAAWIGVLDRSVCKMMLVGSAGVDEKIRDALSQRLDASSFASAGKSIASRAMAEKKVIVSSDSHNDAVVCFAEMSATHDVQSLAVLPLIVADEAVGVIVLYARQQGFFHKEEVRLLTELAADVAFAMDHIDKQERLDYLAYHDVLTGLANRTLFLERAERYLRGAAKGGFKLAMCWFDLERFKNVNDSLGRPAADALLKQVAEWLVDYAADAHVVARIDADRFALLIPQVVGEDDVAAYLEKAIEAFSNHSFALNGTGYRLALKAGVALYPDDGEDAEELAKNAEAALKKAKIGGDRYLFYARKMTETVTGRLTLENQLRRALEFGEYVLHYQPKVEVASGKLVGVEALLRWDDPRTGHVPPAEFIPILEETGLIHEVGRWALRRAIDDYLSWRGAGLPAVPVAVNLSPLQLQNRDFVADLRQALAVDAAAAGGLELELTETLIMEDVKLSIERLGAIRAEGVRIAIDDFGTGFSSLSYLSKLPVDTVKIDRSFVLDMVGGPEGMSLISVIINLAHSLKLKVVAEGVETEEQSRLLRLLGCDEMQGYLLSKPLAAGVFAARFLAASESRLSAGRT
jgi:diguanylate cyclase (GGDEF)-like protein/PAS domain S-box-containing protein